MVSWTSAFESYSNRFPIWLKFSNGSIKLEKEQHSLINTVESFSILTESEPDLTAYFNISHILGIIGKKFCWKSTSDSLAELTFKSN